MERELGSLEMLLLICVELGINGAYELSTGSGMEVSLASPVFQRLLKRHLLNSTKGPRGATRYELTENGQNTLRASLKMAKSRHWRGSSRSSTRSIVLAALYSGIEEAMTCLDWNLRGLSSEQRQIAIEAEDAVYELDRQKEIFSLEPTQANKGSLIMAAHRALTTDLDAHRLKNEIATLESMRPLIQRLPASLPDLPGSEESNGNTVTTTPAAKPAKLDAAREPQLVPVSRTVKRYKKTPDYLGRSTPIARDQQRKKGGHQAATGK